MSLEGAAMVDKSMAAPAALVDQGHGAVEAHAKHGAGFELDVLALGGRDHAAAADQDAGNRALHAAENAADDRADAGAGADALGFVLQAAALERLGHRGTHVAGAAVHGETRELDPDAALALEP